MPTLQAAERRIKRGGETMDENSQQAQTPVNDTQDSPMPSEEPNKTIEEPQVSQNELPDEAKERTRNEFEKLRNDLREERERREAVESAFKQLQPKPVEQPSVLPPIYGADGYLDDAALAERDRLILEASRTTQQLQQQLEQEKQLRAQEAQDREARVAYEAHPELNPNDTKTFNKDLSNRARALILDSMLNPGDYNGKSFSLKEAGDYLKNESGSEVAKARQEAAVEAIEQLSPKEQAALEATANPSRRNDTTGDIEDLRRRTRKGGDASLDAIVQRMKGIKSQ